MMWSLFKNWLQDHCVIYQFRYWLYYKRIPNK